jgi:hypothetical protein
MKTRFLFTLAFFVLTGSFLMGQSIDGGSGVIHVSGDPNLNDDLIGVTVNEGNVAYDRTNQIVYFFNPSGTPYSGSPSASPGTQWVAVDVSAIVAPITSIVTPEDELSSSVVNGVATITFESDATISFDASTSTLTFTDVDGDETDVDLSGTTVFQAANPSITVAGSGTTAAPYTIELTGSDVDTNNGFVPVTDGDGNLSWEKVVKSATFTSTGELQLTFPDNSTVFVNMESIPTVSNVTELAAAAAAVDSDFGGIVRAAANNTFGMPATTNYGVLFFVSN